MNVETIEGKVCIFVEETLGLYYDQMEDFGGLVLVERPLRKYICGDTFIYVLVLHDYLMPITNATYDLYRQRFIDAT